MSDQIFPIKVQHAKHILEDELVGEVLCQMREEALEALTRVDASDMKQILKCQAQVGVIDEFLGAFEAIVLDAQEAQNGADVP